MDESRWDPLSTFSDLEEFEGQPIEPVSDELKIEGIELYPDKDGQRVTVSIAITPTRQQPNLEIVILAPDGTVVAETCVIESRGVRQVVTMHLRSPDPSLTYTVRVGLFRGKELVDACQKKLTWPR
jgi:hypothetical protein